MQMCFPPTLGARTSRRRLCAGLLLATTLLQACATGPTPRVYTSADIAAAEQNGSLEALYAEVSASAAEAGASKGAASLRALQQEIGERLASQRVSSIQAGLAQTTRVEGCLPLAAIEAQRPRMAPLAGWHPTSHQVMNAELEAEDLRTRTAIGDLRVRLEALAASQVLERLQLLDRLSALAGVGTSAQQGFAAEREQVLAGLSRDAALAIETQDYEKARGMLAILQQAKPDDVAAVEQLAAVDTKYFEKNFWQALERGQPDEAYALLDSISKAPSFERVRANLIGSADVMVDSYVKLGAAATQNQDLREAHRRFREARDIRRLFGKAENRSVPEEKPFLDLVHQQYEAALAQKEMGLAWGYLQVIAEMQEATPDLTRELQETRETVMTLATKRLTAARFDDPAGSQPGIGATVGSKVMQFLSDAIPNDIRISERETSLAANASADYLLQGTILEAKVDTSEKHGQRTVHVVTEQEQVPNPEHAHWLDLSSRERRKTPEPPELVIAERKEEVPVEMTLHRKVGLFSVSYRVIDAATASVFFANSARAREEYEDTSHEGVELGDSKLEPERASLPSDMEILSQLADRISETIGAELVKVLGSPEDRYRANAETFLKEGNPRSAAREYAYAIVLSESKDEDASELLEQLRLSAVAASPASDSEGQP